MMVRTQHAAVVWVKEFIRCVWLYQMVQLGAGPIAPPTISYLLADRIELYET
jgi:hypothetical protein